MHFDSPSFLDLQESCSGLGIAWANGGARALSTEVFARRRRLVRSARTLAEMPWLHLWLGVGPSADEVWKRTGPTFCVRTGRRPGRAVLVLPGEPEAYLRGKSRQAVRTNITRARQRGIECRQLHDVREKRTALEQHLVAQYEPGFGIRDWERDSEVRFDAPEVYVAQRAGETEAIAFAFVAGDAAYLIYLRAGRDPEHSGPARYMLSAHLAQELIRRGVRAVLSGSAVGADAGTAYLQQRLGYVAGNVFLHRQPWRAPALAPSLIVHDPRRRETREAVLAPS